MEQALKSVVVPELRSRGFRGSFPHFRRPSETRIDLLMFQFHSSGGSFVVELATCSVDGVRTYWGKIVPHNKITVINVNERLRLGSGGHGDHWFVFGKRSYESGSETVAPPERYQEVAEQVRSLIGTEGERYWERAA